jgi:uncharacterized damage-inducible protein DinB
MTESIRNTPMFTLEGVRKFHRWTHASLTLVLDHLATIPAADYTKELPGFGSPTLHAQVVHIFNCEAYWIHILQALPFTDYDPARWPAVSDARTLQHEVGLRTQHYLSRLTDLHLNGNTELHFPDGDTAVRTPALILHHVLTHAFHHKGQIVAMCRILGHPAPDTDLNQFE